MALSIIIVLYVCVGILAVAGSIFISQKLFSAKAEQIFFALFLVAIAAFYLAFTAYFADEEAWRFETMAVVLFAIFGLVGVRVPFLLIVGYLLHGVWDVLHEVHAFGGTDLFGAHRLTELPLAYGAFCASYDWCIAAYFYTRRSQWRAAWAPRTR
jgi:predicted ABC-type exoprotein transport system permease subunit